MGAHGFLDKINEFAGIGGKASSFLQVGIGPDAKAAPVKAATACRAYHTDWMAKWTAENKAPKNKMNKNLNKTLARQACYRDPGAFSFN